MPDELSVFARVYSNKRRGVYFIFRATSAALILKLYQTNVLFLYIYSTVPFLSVNFAMD